MSSFFFFYTLFILVVCIVTAVMSLAAYASSRRRIFLYACGLFALYATEMTEIFFDEYLMQNIAFAVEEYYEITMPFQRTLIVTGANACVWLMALDVLDKHSRRLFVVPLVCFLLSNLAILAFVPVSPLQQWLYYTMRQVFLFFVLGYLLYSYLTSHDAEFKARLGRYKVPYFILCALTLCVLIEDTYVILLRPASTVSSWLLLYFSERNMSENVLACFLAAVIIVQAFRALSIRMKEAPTTENVADLDRHVDEQLPFFVKAHGLSNREGEVLRLVIMGKNNQEIAQELFLAVGTVKTHVHNILVKTDNKSREQLILNFWKE